MRTLFFIEEPEQLRSVDMDVLRGGTSSSNNDPSCVGHCSGSSCNGQTNPGKGNADGLAIC